MAAARELVLAVLAISLGVFVTFFGRLPAFRNTPISFLHKLLVHRLPAAVRNLDLWATNGRVVGSTARLFHRLTSEKHPLILMFFLGLLTLSAVALIPSIWSLLPLRHRAMIPLGLPLPYLFTYLSARTTSETYITQSNHSHHMLHYPFDHILFHPGNVCETCHFVKPARSKHCSLCKACIARADHHCIWVNNCLGRGNYRWFLALLLSTALVLLYGAYLAYYAVAPFVHEQYALHESSYRYIASRAGPRSSVAGAVDALQAKAHYVGVMLMLAVDAGGVAVSGVGLLALLTWPLPLALFGYHVYLIWAGMTTNESAKWADWRDDMADGLVFLGARHAASFPRVRTGSWNGPGMLGSEEMSAQWPLVSKHVLVRTVDGRPPRNVSPKLASIVVEGSWKQCWSLSSVDNIYDLGFFGNLGEAIR